MPIGLMHALRRDLQQLIQKVLSGPVEGRLEYEAGSEFAVGIEDDKTAEVQACDLVEPEQRSALHQVAGKARLGVVAQMLTARVHAARVERRDDRCVVRAHRYCAPVVCVLNVRTNEYGAGPS